MRDLLRATDWPVMPEVGQALIRTLSDDDADARTVCTIIRKDPALTATLLRMANSAMFGLSGSVDTIDRAVNVVGMSLIRARALSVCMARVAALPAGMDRKTFWRYSMLCAGYAQWLAELCRVNDQEAWLAGMMLRLGEISIGKARPFVLPQVEAQPCAPGERWQRQRQLVGFDEGQVTAELAEHWDFPGELVAALRHAAQPLASGDFSRLGCVLHLAARLADSGAVTQQSAEDLPLLVMSTLKLSTDTLLAQAPDAETLSDTSMFGA
jgi:HD-like signal output (HDOD) protein